MTLHNHVRRIGLFALGMLLFATFAVFTAHKASADEYSVVPPCPASALTEHEALASDSMVADIAVYNIVVAEVEKGAFGRNIMRPVSRKTGRAAILSDNAARLVIEKFERQNKLSNLSRPQIAVLFGQNASIILDNPILKYEYEIVLRPVRYENGKILTKIVVKRTEFCNDKEETHQLLELSGTLTTNNQFALLVNHKLSDKKLVLLVTAKTNQETAQVVSQR